LRRELDFYIKNEVMHLDDVQNASAFADIEKNLRMIQCLRSIALELIDFLGSVGKTFRRSCGLRRSLWCLATTASPEALYAEIVGNANQWKQWTDDGVWNGNVPGTIEDLRSSLYLMVDTSLFDARFKQKILATAASLDEYSDGLVIHSDNTQALRLLRDRYRNQIKCTYIDPPYNTGRDGFAYKDGYQHSSWGCLIRDGLSLLNGLMSDDGMLFISNDDNENENLKKILVDLTFQLKTNLIWNTDGHTDNQFEVKITHEYVTLCQKSKSASYGNVVDPNTRSESNLWKNIAENSITKNGPANPFSDVTLPPGFPVNAESGELFANTPEQAFFQGLGERNYFPRNIIKEYAVSFPIRRNGVTYTNFKLDGNLVVCAGWANLNKLQKFIDNNCQPFPDENGFMEFYLTGNGTIYYKKIKDSARNIVSVLRNFSTTEKMKYTLEGMGLDFTYPKPKDLISYLLKIGSSSTYLDYFAGSGTTAHSVIDMNREDGGKRKYILVEQGDYFDTVIQPRLKKVVFSTEWKDGKPTAPETGVSHCFNVLKLESYEDTLNNLHLRRPSGTGDLFNGMPKEAQGRLPATLHAGRGKPWLAACR
jgi:adenine-specific DNA-methyltransferase